MLLKLSDLGPKILKFYGIGFYLLDMELNYIYLGYYTVCTQVVIHCNSDKSRM